MSWWDQGPILPNLQVIERDDKPAVIYDHNGQPWARPKQPIGFIDPASPPKQQK